MNEKFVEYLNKSFSENKISHAFLIETDNYDRVINDIFHFFLDNDLIFNQLSFDNNISVRCVRPVDNMIDKDSILEIQEFVLTTSFSNKYKIYFIVDAGLMNLSAVNKLLKVLEEPSSDTIGFLLCDSSSGILPTISSRCQLFIDRDNINDYDVNEDIFNSLIEFKNFSYEDYVIFKAMFVSMEKKEIIVTLKKYMNFLFDNNDLFYLKVSDFIDKLRYNINIDLYLDKLFFER